MNMQFFCKNKVRWKKVSESNSINGIDYLEVSSVDQKTIQVFFIHNLPGQPGGIPSGIIASPPVDPTLTVNNVFITGGVRVKNIVVTSVTANNNVLTVEVNKAGDFSEYTLKISNSPTDNDTPPFGFDQQLSSIGFSFKVNCPAEFDCKETLVCPPDTNDEPDINYLAKDYASFNRLMLDRLSTIIPGWQERNPADLEIVLIELLAYMGDHLSYYQDAVATEAYIATARRRVSLKRHARLLDYFVHDGCNARVLAHIEVETLGLSDGETVPMGTALLTNGYDGQPIVGSNDFDQFIVDRDPVVFETMHDLVLRSAHNIMSFYTWQDDDCCLPKGATGATLRNDPALALEKGDILVFEELYNPQTGKKADADPLHRHAVRLKSVVPGTDFLTNIPVLDIEWYVDDAIPFSLVLTSDVENEDNDIPLNEKSVARGNIVLADHGITKKVNDNGNQIFLEECIDASNYYPRLPDKNITVAVAYDHEVEKNNAVNTTLEQDPHRALPGVRLTDSNETWIAQKDLSSSDRFAAEFVVETEQDGSSYLRFGDDTLGKQPISGFQPRAIYRVGNGKEGNIGPEAVDTIVWDKAGITLIRNPLPAVGATDPETMEEVRQFAPQAFRTQERAVTADDYVAKTELHPEVQKAAAKFYWTGSWYTVYIIIDRIGGEEVDDEFKEEIRKHLEQYRMAGYDLEIRGPQFVPLSILLNVCVKQGYLSTNVKQSLVNAFSNREFSDGTKGFFHPDNFTFGQPVYLSAVYQKAMSIQGVASVEVEEFQRWAKNAAGEIEKGLIQPAELEIFRLDNDPDFPENGRISFNMFGGI